jgi:hypothetical protein
MNELFEGKVFVLCRNTREKKKYIINQDEQEIEEVKQLCLFRFCEADI